MTIEATSARVPLARLILEHLSTAVLLLDRQLAILYANPAAEDLLATSAKRLLGTPLVRVLRRTEAAWGALHRAALHGRPFTERRAVLELPDGSQIQVDLTVTPVQQGAEACLLVELQALDRILRINREEALLEAQTTSRDLVRGLAHEIKNPLGGIRGAAQLLASELGEKRSDLAEYTDVIVAEVERLARLVDRMLGPSRPVNRTWLNIHAVTEQVAALLEAEAGGRLAVVRDYDPSLPELRGDKEQLIQAVLNIGRNALEALAGAGQVGAGGRITFRTRVQPHLTIGGKLHRLVCRLEVIDNGPGIPPEIADRIFFPMISGRAEGTGLGLAIAQSVVALHGGLIECDSRPGCTRFTLYLPFDTDHE
ncbi:MAG: PAS domain-containing sensor histidine kinase [Porticoccaceae bacterium]|nr:MAG: PAS domain-containing sensor histidine kinase [Porticoccaceae bacterium]